MVADKTADDSVGSDENPEDAGHLGELPKVDFSTFVLSLGTTALYQLGVMSDPTSGEVSDPDPLIAQQTIDTLEMLREKTLGNLDEEERKLIDSLLYELRMRFVELGR
jgi:hypothetical protein